MKFKWMAKTAGLIMTFLGIEEIPINAESSATDFSPEQMAKLEKELGADASQKILAGFDKEIKNMLGADQSLKAIKDSLDAMVAEADLTAEELAKITANDKGEDTDLNARVTALADKQKEYQAQLKILMEQPEGDTPEAIIRNLTKGTMAHSKTHLFASKEVYDAFDSRPWNARLRDGSIKATDFNTDSAIPTLQGDVEHFVRQNPTVIDSLFDDFEDLPVDWGRRTGVLDRISNGFIIPGEIVQARKGGFQAKNKFKFVAEEGKVYAKKIDISFNGHELQSIETTWVAQVKQMDGTHPWKMSFIGFLLSELVKQQKVDDRIAQVNGIFVLNPDEDTAGANVNSQNGLRYLWYHYRDIKKQYRPFSIGAPTDANIVDYIEKMISLIPEEQRSAQGMEIELSDRWLKAYRKRAGDIYTLQYASDAGNKEYKGTSPIDRPNYKFQVLKDQTNTDFIGITRSKNIEVMDYNASEKGKFTVTHDKRNTDIFADYKIGIRFLFVGTKLAAGEPKQFEAQRVWSNDVPVFGPDVTVPVYDDRSGILKVVYNHMVVDEKWVTDIADATGEFVPGQIVRITGNDALAGAKKVKNNAKFSLASDFALNTGGTLTLYVTAQNTFKEIERTDSAPVVAEDSQDFTTATVDADEARTFIYTGSADKAITGVLNGVEGQNIQIYGTDAVDVDVTFSTTGNIKMASNASLGKAADYVQLTLVAGLWRETDRLITV